MAAAKQAGLWDEGISTAKLAKRIEGRIAKAYGDRQLTRWLTADPKAPAPDADVQARVLGLLNPKPSAARASRDLPLFETEAERRAATLTILYFAQQLGPQLVETIDRAVQTLLVTVSVPTGRGATPDEAARYAAALDAAEPARDAAARPRRAGTRK